MIIASPRAELTLRPLSLGDCSEQYRAWFDDPDVIRHLEVGPQTIESLREYVVQTKWLFGIFHEGLGHVGNIKLSPTSRHPVAEVSLVIGEKTAWGQGLAAAAIRAISAHAFERLRVQKLWAGMYADNIASIRAFVRAGYKHEALHRAHYCRAGHMTDIVEVGLCKNTAGQGVASRAQ